eukprot:SM002412S08203  [mRNA]  locus=s2412:2:1631:- [translate_table: standard]
MVELGGSCWHAVRRAPVMPQARASHSMAMVQDKLVIYGGGSHGGRHLDDTWVTCPSKLLLPEGPLEGVEWCRVSDKEPFGRFQQSCTVVGQVAVIFGGINDFGTRLSDTWVCSDFQAPGTGRSSSWEKLEVGASPSPRGAHAACYAGAQRVLMYGGIGPDGVRLDDMWILDLAEDLPTWREATAWLRSQTRSGTSVARRLCVLQVEYPGGPSARSGHTITWLGNRRVLLFGGRGTKFDVLSDTWLLDLSPWSAGGGWVELRALGAPSLLSQPSPRAGHSATPIFGGRVLVFGGEDGQRVRQGDVWVVDPCRGIPVGSGVGSNGGGGRGGRGGGS